MKKIILSILVVVFCGFQFTEYALSHERTISHFGIFYRALEPYGEWIEFDGIFVWRPIYVRHGWRPYLHGRWIWTDYGWYWYSYEPFGWAVFHYGRWYYDDYYGWIWVPDNIWGPAWVEWRYCDRYIGWAPLPPHSYFSIRIGIIFSSTWVAPVHYWNFVPCERFVSTRIAEYIQPIERTRRIFGSTRSIGGIEYERDRIVNRGVDVSYVEKHTRTRVRKAEVVQTDQEQGERIRNGRDGRRIEVFRPQIERESPDEQNRPTRIKRAERPLQIDGENIFKREIPRRLTDEQIESKRDNIYDRRKEYDDKRNRIQDPKLDIYNRPERTQREKHIRTPESQRETNRERIRPRDEQRFPNYLKLETERSKPQEERKSTSPYQRDPQRERKPR